MFQRWSLPPSSGVYVIDILVQWAIRGQLGQGQWDAFVNCSEPSGCIK